MQRRRLSYCHQGKMLHRYAAQRRVCCSSHAAQRPLPVQTDASNSATRPRSSHESHSRITIKMALPTDKGAAEGKAAFVAQLEKCCCCSRNAVPASAQHRWRPGNAAGPEDGRAAGRALKYLARAFANLNTTWFRVGVSRFV
jgi:hypothetical protein